MGLAAEAQNARVSYRHSLVDMSTGVAVDYLSRVNNKTYGFVDIGSYYEYSDKRRYTVYGGLSFVGCGGEHAVSLKLGAFGANRYFVPTFITGIVTETMKPNLGVGVKYFVTLNKRKNKYIPITMDFTNNYFSAGVGFAIKTF